MFKMNYGKMSGMNYSKSSIHYKGTRAEFKNQGKSTPDHMRRASSAFPNFMK